MWLIVMRGLPGCGKSTLSRALSKHLNWPLIDKDDVRDMLGDEIPGIGGLAYEIMFNVARRQLLQGLNVICDSPLVARESYDRAKAIANETQAYLAVIDVFTFLKQTMLFSILASSWIRQNRFMTALLKSWHG